MDLKIYEKTRYQNIYRHKKHKNYVVRINKPVRTSVSVVKGKQITRLEDALRVRDNPHLKIQKGIEIASYSDFYAQYTNYTNYCKNTLKLAKNSLLRKDKTYTKYLRGVFQQKLSKIVESDITYYLI